LQKYQHFVLNAPKVDFFVTTLITRMYELCFHEIVLNISKTKNDSNTIWCRTW